MAVGTTSTWKQVEQEMEQEVKEEEEEEEEEKKFKVPHGVKNEVFPIVA